MSGGRRSGITLVELMAVSLLTAVTLAGVYQTLSVHRESYATAARAMEDRERLRTALGILGADVREIGAVGGLRIGGTDIAAAERDSITFRTPRKPGFLCDVAPQARRATAWIVGAPFVAGDRVLVFIDGDSLRHTDDRWDTATVTTATHAEDPDCTARWPVPLQEVALDGSGLTGLRAGSPIRSYEWVTYGLYPVSGSGWALGRRSASERPTYLVAGLAPPGEGLRFEYASPAGTATDDPGQVASVRITVRTAAVADAVSGSRELSARLVLRNN